MAEFAQYREITNKLKKRFTLRKPNYREASDSFKRLSAELSQYNDYSGYCMLSAAQCEHNLVNALKEQISSSTSLVGSSSSSSVASIPLLSQLNSTSASSKSIASPLHSQPSSHQVHSLCQSHQFDIKTGLDRLLENATNLEFQTFLDAARLFRGKIKPSKDGDEEELGDYLLDLDSCNINSTISAYADAIRCCPPKMLTIVHCELAQFYASLERYHEAGEIYYQVGLYREAGDCLLSGHHFELAYQCYLELFRQCQGQISTNPHNHYHRQTSSRSGSHLVHQHQEPPLSQTGSKSSRTNSEHSSNFVIVPSIGANSIRNPFMLNESYLTIDDHITIFLLRLYLYDPVKYEYASPIIPFPDEIQNNSNYLDFNRSSEVEVEHRRSSSSAAAAAIALNSSQDNEDNGDNGDTPPGNNNDGDELSSSYVLNTETLTLPFIDFVSGKLDRTTEDLIELNMLLETLYLSYRNEFKQTVDNEIVGFGDEGRDLDDRTTSFDETDSSSVIISGEDDETEITNVTGDEPKKVEPSNSGDDSTNSKIRKSSNKSLNFEEVGQEPEEEELEDIKSPDSVDEEHEPNPVVSSLETLSKNNSTNDNDNNNNTTIDDDFSSRLQQLTMKYCSNVEIDDNDDGVGAGGDNLDYFNPENFLKSEELLSKKLEKQFRSTLRRKKGKFFLNQDYYLRKEISTKLYPLLNYQQNQLVYQILADKD